MGKSPDEDTYLDGWMAAYSFICGFHLLCLRFADSAVQRFLPSHFIFHASYNSTRRHPCEVSILLRTAEDPTSTVQSIPAPERATEGSVPLQANIQGIQNLTGASRASK